MAEVTWVLERNVFSERAFNIMINHFTENRIPYHVLTIIPFSHQVEGKVPVIEGPVVCYGSIGIQKLAEKQGWSPGIWTNEEFSEKAFIKRLGKHALNNDMIFTKIKDVLTSTDLDVFFIKPNSDTKEFAGTVMTRDGFNGWVEGMHKSGYVDESFFDLEVGVCLPTTLGCEWRFVMVDGEVSSCSYYRQYQRVLPEAGAPKHVIDYARWIAAHVDGPAGVYVMDIAEVHGNNDTVLRVIEYNTFNSSGLYNCDVAKIIDDVNEYVGRISDSNS